MPEIASAEDPLDLSLSEAELEELRTHITTFIQRQREQAGASIGVVAISGGIDSSLTAHLAVEALGTAHVYGIIMPSSVNRNRNMSDAERVAGELLDIEYDVIEIDHIVKTMLDEDPHSAREDIIDEGAQLAVGNLRARIRAVLSYFEANLQGGFVLGTGNRSEAAVGYFTKYGDGAVDCHPIATLYKSQVRQLARHVGVPEDLVVKTPTAELWDDQTDEAEFGMDYDTLDSILALHIDGPLSVSATAKQIGVDEGVVMDVRDMYEASAHKRQVPPGPEPLW